jgi:predicted pyridoxine 5'-phosphate oxidase superfamily flavin-nucleotide-binding protein
MFHEKQIQLQAHFDTRKLADRLQETIIQPVISPEDQAYVADKNMFFLATVDDQGQANCSYKGGARGFVKVLDEKTLAFPIYDGNGMYMSAGNVLANPNVGMLFIDFEQQSRLRINGVASVDLNDPLLAEYPEAHMVVRVAVRETFPNCPRYIHKMQLVEESAFVPSASCATPAPLWKSLALVADVLPTRDAHLAGSDEDPAAAINRK